LQSTKFAIDNRRVEDQVVNNWRDELRRQWSYIPKNEKQEKRSADRVHVDGAVLAVVVVA
jgi:hypothetical protein